MTEPRLPAPTTATTDGPADDVERLLASYARHRLAPRYGAMARIRTALFHRLEARRLLAIAPPGTWRSRVARRLMAAGLAATLVLAAAATVVTAGPASPFYGARLWLETVTLPAAADDRAETHRDRLEARLEEAEEAAAAGNGAAVAQALAAYRSEVEAALADVGDDAEQLARLEAALGTHLVVLGVLAERVPPQAADAIQNAMNASNKAVERIKEKKAHPDRPQGSPRAER
jgi:hypothetical protein